MPYQLFPAAERGHITWDWLDTYHSFSFGYFYRPDLIGFGTLRIINDNTITPGEVVSTPIAIAIWKSSLSLSLVPWSIRIILGFIA